MVRAYHKRVPKKVDHDERRRQITDAVCRITLRSGLGAATFREVAKEADMSVRLVQYYFGTKAQLVDVTLEHVGERSIARVTRWIEATDGSPRDVLGAFLKSFIPRDEESRVAMLMYIAIAAENAVGDSSANHGGRTSENQLMLAMAEEQLGRGPIAPGLDPKTEAAVITSMMPGLGNFIVEGLKTPDEVAQILDYHLDRLFQVEPTANTT